eukprot:m.86586 g.86586  ORF g.86586 m.86586 type:complete len:290 (-) comp15098_c0_seq1:384-1253(-)
MAASVRDIIAEEALTASWIRPNDDATATTDDWAQMANALTQRVAAALPAGGAADATADSDAVQATFSDGQLNCAYMDLDTLPRTLSEEYGSRTIRLDLSNNNFTQIPNLADFPALQELVLDNNSLDDSVQIPNLQRVHTLSLNKNCLKDLDSLLVQLQKSLPSLNFLSLLGNEACPNELVAKDEDDYQRYRYAVLFKLPGLKFLDSRAVTATEKAEAKRIGAFTKVARFTDDEYQKQVEQQKPDEGPMYSPLSKETREPENHRATFGQSKFAYYGRHSEGNRFIRNSDL